MKENLNFFIIWCLKSKFDMKIRFNASFCFKTNDFGLKFRLWIRRILENKNITSPGRYHCFSVNSRLPVTSDTTLSERTRLIPITWKKPFDNISNLGPVIWSSIFNYVKKLPQLKWVQKILQNRDKINRENIFWGNFMPGSNKPEI